MCHFENSTREFLVIGYWFLDFNTMKVGTFYSCCWKKLLGIARKQKKRTVHQFILPYQAQTF